MYKIELSASAYRWLKKNPGNTPEIERLRDRLVGLGEDPRPAGCEKLKGSQALYLRIRQGDYRIIYEIIEGEKKVVIVSVGHRREIYRKLSK